MEKNSGGIRCRNVDWKADLLDNSAGMIDSPVELNACLNAHGLYNFFQCVLRLSPEVHRKIAAMPGGIVAGEIDFDSLFRSGKHGISSVMRKLLTWYAQYFNRRHKRVGHLFENRYKSILCGEDNYLPALVRYIHLNLIQANIVKSIEELDRYKWRGHRALIENAKLPWMDSDRVLLQFGSTMRMGLSAYRAFMQEGVGLGHQPELTGGGVLRNLGGLVAGYRQTPYRSRGRGR